MNYKTYKGLTPLLDESLTPLEQIYLFMLW